VPRIRSRRLSADRYLTTELAGSGDIALASRVAENGLLAEATPRALLAHSSSAPFELRCAPPEFSYTVGYAPSRAQLCLGAVLQRAFHVNCPLCHAASSVIRTDGNRRRRECVTCRYRWNTVELADPELKRLRRLAEVAADLTEVLRGDHVAELQR
jgi:hypothetical protein